MAEPRIPNERGLASAGRYPGQAPIDAYGNGGFRFAGMSHRGAILCLPQSIEAWAPITVADIDPAALAPLVAVKAQITILLLGTGTQIERPSRAVIEHLASAGVGLDIMDTGAACRTYNILLGERRPVAAALLPVP